jgi:hypothetical protein
MPENDRVKVIANAIHPIRLLQLAYNPAEIDYFSTENHSYVTNAPTFTSLVNSNEFVCMKDLVQSLKLDAKELALFSACLAFSSGNFENYFLFKLFKINLV